MDHPTKITLTVENPKPNYRYYVSCGPLFQGPIPIAPRLKAYTETETDSTTSTISSEEENYIMRRAARHPPKPEPKTTYQTHCKCGKFVKKGQTKCSKC